MNTDQGNELAADGSSKTIKTRVWSAVCRLPDSLSRVGLVLAGIFFALSLTPSLLPRIYIVQGLLGGIALAVGYGIGVFLDWLWQYMEVPRPNKKIQRLLSWLSLGGAFIFAIVFLRRATIWQNSVRQLMEMDKAASAYPVTVTLIAIVFGLMLVFAGRVIGWCFRQVDRRINRFLPRRVSYVLTTFIVGYLLILMVNGVLARNLLKAADAMFLQIDKVIDEEFSQPTNPLASGSDQSLIPWKTIGRKGQEFVVAEPNKAQISEFTGVAALEPLRVYVGVRTKDTPEERAEIAFQELLRVGGFERSVLIVATPTGTGWLDPGAVHTLEYLHGGDTAIVATQYSYLPSWLTIMVDPNRSVVAAQTLFDRVYEHWRTLPKNDRPKLYLQGLSLGALGSEKCTDLFTLIQDPIHGALWSGPPFPSTVWKQVSKDRNPDSTIWLPTFRDGKMMRFTGQKNSLEEGKPWGPMRFVYVQYASDPMSFFSPDLLFQRPAWLNGQRGPDVSPYLDWYPVVTFLQVGCDLPMATSVPVGYGHNISPSNYIDGWIAVTDPKGWDAEKIGRLKNLFMQKSESNK